MFSLKRLWTKPPVIFPMVALFHLLITIHAFWTFKDILSIDALAWAHPVCLLLYTIIWISLCDLKKWAAFAYVGLMCVNLCLHYFVPPAEGFSTALFPADLIFSFLVLIYFKRFE